LLPRRRYQLSILFLRFIGLTPAQLSGIIFFQFSFWDSKWCKRDTTNRGICAFNSLFEIRLPCYKKVYVAAVYFQFSFWDSDLT